MSSASSTARRVLHGGTALLSASVLVLSGFGWATANHFDEAITRTSVFASDDSDVDPEARPTVDPRAGDSMNILLVGSDNRDGLSVAERRRLHVGQKDYGERTDTMMIIHIGQDTSHVSVVGLPRDSRVTIPAYKDSDGVRHDSLTTRINEAFPRGGPRLMVKTVEKATGIHIDHYVEVSFTAFLGMVDAVGGVEVCLVKPLKDDPRYTHLDLPAGKSLLKGAMALDFVRSRHVDSDFGRIQRQQQFIASMLKKAMSADMLRDPLKLNDFVTAALENTKVDETLDRDAILELAGRLQGISFSSIEFPQIPIESASWRDPVTNAALVKWDDAGAAKLFEAIRTDTPITREAAGKAPKLTVDPSDISVTVFNGTTTTGLGKTVTDALDGLGYDIAGKAAAWKSTDRTTTVIRYDPAYADSAKTLAATFPGAVLKRITGQGSTFEVVVGTDYVGVTTPTIGKASAIDATVASDTVCGN